MDIRPAHRMMQPMTKTTIIAALTLAALGDRSAGADQRQRHSAIRERGHLA